MEAHRLGEIGEQEEARSAGLRGFLLLIRVFCGKNQGHSGPRTGL